jgi:tetraacyldisaccharide 4'-kinase
MREPSFWWEKPGLAARLLQPLGILYGIISANRMNRTGARAGIPVICVGNFTLGGTGKTPTALAIAQLLIAAGERPFFLTRGYGGGLEGPIAVDATVHRAADVGDEPLLLARKAPVIVAQDRAAGARMAKESGATVVIMDDGLQNPSLQKDMAIAVVDARRGLGNGLVFPAGPLRAPLKTQMAKTGAVLVVGESRQTPRDLEAMRASQPVLRGRLEPNRATLKALANRKVLAFAGIGDPEKFFMALAGAGIEATIEESFPDHHRYSDADAERLLAQAEAKGLLPLTTEKDLVRLGETPALMKLATKAKALPVAMIFDDEKAVKALLRDALAAARAS